MQDAWVLRGFSASMARIMSFLAIFGAILAEKWPYRPCNAGYGHFYTQGMAILVEGRQDEKGIPGARQYNWGLTPFAHGRYATVEKLSTCKRGLTPIVLFYCREPISRKNKPRRTRMRSMTLLLRFFSWNRRAPQRKLTITLERRIMETMETMDALWARETK